MNNRSFVNLLLFSFLMSAAGWFFYKNNQAVEVTRLTHLNINKINMILIPKDNGNDILFKKTKKNNESQWVMIKPYQINAHQFRVNTLLSLTQTPVDKAYDTSDLNLADYSLDTPRARILFNNTEIFFGKSNPLNNKRYIMSNNKMALLLDQTYPLVSAQAASFVDLSLINTLSNITAIKFSDLAVSKDENNLWQSTPANKLNTDQIQQLVEQWKTVQAFSVHRYLQRKQLGNIDIYIDNKPVSFIVSDDDPWLIIARPDLNIEYHLDTSFKNKLFVHFKSPELKKVPDDA